MFKVLIVDDEPTTRQGLTMLIPWETYGFEVVDTAANGNEAIEKHQSQSPDLIIVDIRMPGMSGIELIERIRNVDTTVHFLILSGHAEFEYAKKAIVYNVGGYLLKPVDEDELVSYLQEIQTKLEQEIEYHKVRSKLDQENKGYMIQAALVGDIQEQVKGYFDNSLKWSKYRVLLIDIDENTFELNEIIDELTAVFEKTNLGIVFAIQSKLGVLLNGELDFSQDISNIYRKLKKIFKGNHSNFNTAISDTVMDINDLSTAYQSAFELISNHFFYDEAYIIHEKSDSVVPKEEPVAGVEEQLSLGDGDQLSMTNVVDRLLYIMEVGDERTVERICNQFAMDMIRNSYSEDLIKKSFVQLVSSLLNKLNYEYKEIQAIVADVLSRVFEIENQRNLKHLLNYVCSLLFEIIDQMDVKDTDVLVKKMINLIERNYHKNIKLDMLSEILNYNRAYLGKLFKKYTGENFNTYLDKVRIKNGKKLLLQGFKVYQVAERIGYSNVDYFHSKFKKYEGMSPSTYRKTNMTDEVK